MILTSLKLLIMDFIRTKNKFNFVTGRMTDSVSLENVKLFNLKRKKETRCPITKRTYHNKVIWTQNRNKQSSWTAAKRERPSHYWLQEGGKWNLGAKGNISDRKNIFLHQLSPTGYALGLDRSERELCNKWWW